LVHVSKGERITYGLTARLRLAIADQAAQITDSAADLVPTCADGYGSAVDLVEMAYHLAADCAELLDLSIAYARQTGVSWDALGDVLGVGARATQEQYGAAVKQIIRIVLTCWLLGDDSCYGSVPEAATNPDEGAGRLDRWVQDHLTPAGPRSRYCLRKDPCCLCSEDPASAAPVSYNLPALDIGEHQAFIAAGTQIIREQLSRGTDDDQVLRLKLRLAQQKVALLERLFIEATIGNETGAEEADRLAGQLEKARGELEELEQRTGGDSR
jgi:hypothetical protein